MHECNSNEAVNTYSSLSDQTKVRLNNIVKIEGIWIQKFKKEK